LANGSVSTAWREAPRLPLPSAQANEVALAVLTGLAYNVATG